MAMTVAMHMSTSSTIYVRMHRHTYIHTYIHTYVVVVVVEANMEWLLF